VSASQTQSVNNRFRSGKSGSPLTKKPNRSQSSSPGHLPFHTSRRGSSPWKCAQPSADQPQCGKRSISQPARWCSPMGAPQSGHGQPLDRAVTAISPLTRSLERAATLFRTRPLPCHHPLTGNWDGSLISTRSHWCISSRTTEANASRLSAQIAKRWEPGLASDSVKVTIGFTCPGPHVWQRLAITGLLNRDSDAFGDGFSGAAALWIILGKTG
jgi:hypothetical protein